MKKIERYECDIEEMRKNYLYHLNMSKEWLECVELHEEKLKKMKEEEDEHDNG